MTSLEIAEQTWKEHSHVMRDIRNMLYELGIDESKFGSIYLDSYGREQKCFRLDKRRVQVLIMWYEAKLCDKVLDYIETLENKKPLSLQEMTLLVIEGQKKEIEEMKEKILMDAPKVAFASAIEWSATSVPIGNWVKAISNEGKLKMWRNKVFSWMRESGYLMEKNIPYQRYIDQWLFEVKEGLIVTTKWQMATWSSLLTGKGQIYFLDKLSGK